MVVVEHVAKSSRTQQKLVYRLTISVREEPWSLKDTVFLLLGVRTSITMVDVEFTSPDLCNALIGVLGTPSAKLVKKRSKN